MKTRQKGKLTSPFYTVPAPLPEDCNMSTLPVPLEASTSSPLQQHGQWAESGHGTLQTSLPCSNCSGKWSLALAVARLLTPQTEVEPPKPS